MADSICGQILTTVCFPSNVVCSAKLSDMMDQAPCITEAPQTYTPTLNLLHHKVFYF